MGISVVGCYDFREHRYRVFTQSGRDQFAQLCSERDLLVGFNNIPFDNKVLAACWNLNLPEAKCYDLLRQVWAAVGLGPNFSFKHAGYGLEAICQKNFGLKKTGNGALAPVLWQQGRIGEVIDYCLEDNRLTKFLFEAVLGGPILCPKTGNPITVTRPLIHVEVNHAGSAGTSQEEKTGSAGAAAASVPAADRVQAAGPATR